MIVPARSGWSPLRRLPSPPPFASSYTAILEYQLPYDLRRIDLIVLERAAVVVA
jgi:hypothetical protein